MKKLREAERECAQGESLLDVASKTTRAVAAEYAQYTEATWSSKGMLEVIRRKMSAAALDSPDKPSTSTSSPLGAVQSVPEQFLHMHHVAAHCAALPLLGCLRGILPECV